MPRKYIPRQKTYKKYDASLIKAAIEDYECGGKPLSKLAEYYGINKSVLQRHIHREMKSQGGQTALKKETEMYIVKYLNVCSQWGYSLDIYDLRIIIKRYLDKRGIEIKRFKNNLPGVDYVENFIKRNNDEISERIKQNIKKTTAEMSSEIIEEYFEELKVKLKNVPLSNVVNYGEFNLSNDPRKRKVLTKRGTKYPKQAMNHIQSSTSVMMAISADGTMLPWYVVYKAAHVETSWTENGPINCQYNRSSSGWFDGTTFENWVDTVILPYFKGKFGEKLLIGDNLCSHLSIDLIQRCREQNVHFLFFPAKSLHLTQPLDVAFFSPLSDAWHDILSSWEKAEGQTESIIPRKYFPQLLGILFKQIQSEIQQNILASFAETGINPLNKKKVLMKLSAKPSADDTNFSENKLALEETVLSLLKDLQYDSENLRSTDRKRKLNIKSEDSFAEHNDDVTIVSDLNSLNSNSTSEIEENEVPGISEQKTKGRGIRKKAKIQDSRGIDSTNNDNKPKEIIIIVVR